MYLYGASGHSKVIIDILKQQHVVVEAVLDDTPKSDFICGIPVVKTSDIILDAEAVLVVSIGNNTFRKRIAESLNVRFYTAIHSSAVVSPSTILGMGTVVMPNAVINAFSTLGNHCIVNSGAIVEHDCVLENYVHISPNAALAGGVSVGEGTQIGIGASVIQGIKIGKWVTVGAGAVIIEDLPDYAIVVGNPGRIIKFNEPS
ncbi:4-keto-6-deoxy-N-Acetyl-D-hexosaminyl-(Lipid carrier) aminotransferase [Flavobacterium cauense R2A-7]|uniref:Acetyltransferase EpsM n=1 Tax=Flavobacterium cauense R2A-7 TaxID=1341154 RepID=V6S328_9FLAO|nr:acetyltransferase [Flavobacterium cauense]ESU20814.1 4-keto-6-deoxy-N-Acetyl-D-hexosaminyl-(Lipid carrier) aminotransferase [Flavobacterium cauense R2A-7]KGO82821.1 acetyltransferase [Flavobacterium cauense R2A-7]TWI12155.1 acetyltransferase EpsM [Flavobacterium cauense R2A-7]